MRVLFSARFVRSFREAPEKVQRDFGKQLGHLLRDLRHPSLRAKKYDEAKGIWQARVNGGWRFYFTIEGDIYSTLSPTLKSYHSAPQCSAAWREQLITYGCAAERRGARRFR